MKKLLVFLVTAAVVFSAADAALARPRGRGGKMSSEEKVQAVQEQIAQAQEARVQEIIKQLPKAEVQMLQAMADEAKVPLGEYILNNKGTRMGWEDPDGDGVYDHYIGEYVYGGPDLRSKDSEYAADENGYWRKKKRGENGEFLKDEYNNFILEEEYNAATFDDSAFGKVTMFGGKGYNVTGGFIDDFSKINSNVIRFVVEVIYKDSFPYTGITVFDRVNDGFKINKSYLYQNGELGADYGMGSNINENFFFIKFQADNTPGLGKARFVEYFTEPETTPPSPPSGDNDDNVTPTPSAPTGPIVGGYTDDNESNNNWYNNGGADPQQPGGMIAIETGPRDVPLASAPEMEIFDDEVPLANGLSWMVPLGSLPLTGESNLIAMLGLGLALSVTMMAASLVMLRKCRNF